MTPACTVAGMTYAIPPATEAAPVAQDPFTNWVQRLAARIPSGATPILVGLCFLSAAGYTLASNPTNASASDNPTCLVKLTTGFDCPGCGGTRAFWYLLHGDVPAAARSHIFAVFAAPFLAYWYVGWVAKRVFNKQLPMPRITPTMVGFFLGAWAVWAVLRNLPWAPFTWFFV
jgi:Protein of unknown function (DUF2752)